MSEMRLRPMKYSEISLFQDWRNNPDQWDHVRNPLMVSNEDQERWWKRIQKDRTHVLFTIERKSDLHQNPHEDGFQVIGMGGITNIEWLNRAGEMSLLLEFPKNVEWAVDALEKIVAYGHDVLNLHRLWVECYTDERVALFSDVGFHEEGRKRHAVWRGGTWRDGVLLSRFQGASVPRAPRRFDTAEIGGHQ